MVFISTFPGIIGIADCILIVTRDLFVYFSAAGLRLHGKIGLFLFYGFNMIFTLF